MTSADREHGEIALVGRSRIIALAVRIAEVGAASMQDARAMEGWRTLGPEFLALTLAEQIRWVAVTLAVAASGHLLLLALVPTRLRPAVPTTLWMIVAGASTALALTAPALAVAWRMRRSRWRGRHR